MKLAHLVNLMRIFEGLAIGALLPQLLQSVVMVNLLGEHLEKATSYARQNPLGKSITMEKPNQKLAEKWATSPLQHLAYQKR